MSDKLRVIDGADRRKKRLLELLVFIHNNGGATEAEMKAFMLMRFGLKYDTTAQYIQELHLSKLITIGDKAIFYTTQNYKKYAKYLYG